MGARTNYVVPCSCLPIAAPGEVLVKAVSAPEFSDVSFSSMDYSQVKDRKCLCPCPRFLQMHVCQLVKKWGNGDALRQEGYAVLFECHRVHAAIALLECKRISSKYF